MGCDIHFHIEVKISNTWEHYACPNIERNYSLFSLMANVRSETGLLDAFVDPKGLPEDLTFITFYDYKRMEEDAHSASWYNRKEIIEFSDIAQKEFILFSVELDLLHTYLFGNHFKYSDEFDFIQDIRFIFWFDN